MEPPLIKRVPTTHPPLQNLYKAHQCPSTPTELSRSKFPPSFVPIINLPLNHLIQRCSNTHLTSFCRKLLARKCHTILDFESVRETILDESHPDRLASQQALANAMAICAQASDGTFYSLDACIQLKSSVGSGHIPKARQFPSWFRNPLSRRLSALKHSGKI